MAVEEAQSSLTLAGVLLNTLPVVIGGLLTAGGGFLGAFVSYRLGKKKTKVELKRQKIEQLVGAAYRAMHWLDLDKNVKLFGYQSDLNAPPISEVEMLGTLYVPELKYEVARLSLVVAEYSQWIVKGQEEKLHKSKISDETVKAYKPIYTELTRAVGALAEKAAELTQQLD